MVFEWFAGIERNSQTGKQSKSLIVRCNLATFIKSLLMKNLPETIEPPKRQASQIQLIIRSFGGEAEGKKFTE